MFEIRFTEKIVWLDFMYYELYDDKVCISPAYSSMNTSQYPVITFTKVVLDCERLLNYTNGVKMVKPSAKFHFSSEFTKYGQVKYKGR